MWCIKNAPKAKLGFNTKPSDTAETVQRWVNHSGPLKKGAFNALQEQTYTNE